METNITIALTPAQLSAVEIYVTDPAHDEDNLGKVSLQGKRIVFATGVTATEAFEILCDAANACDETAIAWKHSDPESAKLERKASRVLTTIASKALRIK